MPLDLGLVLRGRVVRHVLGVQERNLRQHGLEGLHGLLHELLLTTHRGRLLVGKNLVRLGLDLAQSVLSLVLDVLVVGEAGRDEELVARTQLLGPASDLLDLLVIGELLHLLN